MSADDPLPGLLDLPLFAYKHFYNAYKTLREGVPSAKGCPTKVEVRSGAPARFR